MYNSSFFFLQAPIESRIPTFNSRIPIPGKLRNTFIVDSETKFHTTIVAPRGEKQPTPAHVGKKVCVGNEQFGVLRFVGEVRFNAGLWCGIELEHPVGKHDGFVKGVRYFSCRAGCGIMAPISKVTLQCDNKISSNKDCDTISNNQMDDSGPFSLIEVESQCPDALTLATHLNTTTVLCFNKRLSAEIASNSCDYNSDCISPNSTLTLNSLSPRAPSNLTSSTPVSQKMVKCNSLELTDSSDLDKTITKSTPSHSPVVTPSLTKQNSFEMDESLGILTPDQMIDFSNFVKNSKTMSADDLKSILIPRRIHGSRTPSSENLGSLQKESSTSLTPVDTVQSARAIDESSLAILTPEQMTDFSVFASQDINNMMLTTKGSDTLSNSRTPSSENLGSLPNDGFKIPDSISIAATRPQSIDLRPIAEISTSTNIKLSEISSPNAVENSIIDFSLGLIEEDMLATGNQFSSLIDTTTNLELPLDSVSGDCKLAEFKSLSRSDQTPSPEDLPLDPIDPIKPVELEIIEPNTKSNSDPAVDLEGSSKSTTTKTNSFITSVTSITSLDTGYQGDGEMSRPASRGADHSPMTHKPNNPALVNLHWQRAITRRQDPMTDSDFFTESDADVHEENAPRGDRRAQVIDGTLYGVHAQAEAAAQDIFIGNQEEMDSSGIFTDLDMNPRGDDFSDNERNRMEIVTEDKSPSDISTKTISENSQEIKEPVLLDKTIILVECDSPMITESISEKAKSPTQSITSTASRKSSRSRTPLSKDENPSKKLKMPKRNVTSKVKSMMEQKQNEIENKENRKTPARKPVGRWDAVMNKISKGQEEDKSKIRLKEVKSKVSTRINEPINSPEKRSENRKFTARDSPTTKLKM